MTPNGIAELAIRILFFFRAAIIVNRFAIENRRQTIRYQTVAERLADTNLRLELAMVRPLVSRTIGISAGSGASAGTTDFSLEQQADVSRAVSRCIAGSLRKCFSVSFRMLAAARSFGIASR